MRTHTRVETPVLDASSLAMGDVIRNRNFLKKSVYYLTLAVAMLALNIVSSFGLRWLGVVALVWFLAVSAWSFVRWRCTTLELGLDGIWIGGVFRSSLVPWGNISDFQIREPARRTPLMVSLYWWADQARVVLRDGTKRRLRAVQPYHGQMTISYFAETDADRIVADLNERATSQSG